LHRLRGTEVSIRRHWIADPSIEVHTFIEDGARSGELVGEMCPESLTRDFASG
jgi:hypothetical protein